MSVVGRSKAYGDVRWSSTLTFITGSVSSPNDAGRGLCYVPHKSSSCFSVTPLCLGTQLICQAELAGKFFCSVTETVRNSQDGLFGLFWHLKWPAGDDRRPELHISQCFSRDCFDLQLWSLTIVNLKVLNVHVQDVHFFCFLFLFFIYLFLYLICNHTSHHKCNACVYLYIYNTF